MRVTLILHEEIGTIWGDTTRLTLVQIGSRVILLFLSLITPQELCLLSLSSLLLE